MSPISSFEEASCYSQTTAQSVRQSTTKLDGMLRAVNDLLLRSYGDEISVPVPSQDATSASDRGPGLASLINAFGIYRFEYRAKDEDLPRQELALGLRYTTSRKTKSGVASFKWVPLVPLAGSGAPRLASRRLRLWAGQNLPYLIGLLAGGMFEKVQNVAAAAKHAQKLKVTAGRE